MRWEVVRIQREKQYQKTEQAENGTVKDSYKYEKEDDEYPCYDRLQAVFSRRMYAPLQVRGIHGECIILKIKQKSIVQ